MKNGFYTTIADPINGLLMKHIPKQLFQKRLRRVLVIYGCYSSFFPQKRNH